MEPQSHGLEHLPALAAHVVHHHRIRKAQGNLVVSGTPVHRHPVAQAHGHDALFVPAPADVLQIAQHGMGVLPDDFRIPSVLIDAVRELEQDAVPGRAVPPLVAPGVRGHDAGQHPVRVLGEPDIVQPLPIALLRSQGHHDMLRGSRRVPGPAVLLPVGAVRGEVVEIGQVAAPSYLAYLVGRLVGAGKAPTLL